jgi:hypothetical protein
MKAYGRSMAMVNIMPRPLYAGENKPGTHSIADWLDPRDGLDGLKERKVSGICSDSSPGESSL